jgi:hypothetical protein
MIEKWGILVVEKCANWSQYTNYLYGYTGNPPQMTIVDCYDIRTATPPQLIPYPYQGWFMVALLIIGTIAIGYGLYLIAHDPLDNSPKIDPNYYYYMTESEIKKKY